VVDVGERAPGFDLETTGGRVTLRELSAAGPVVVAFYTEDATPVCSTQITALKNDYDLLRELGARVVAISTDSLESHRAFGEWLGGVPFDLASDTDLAVAKAYGVADEVTKRSQRAIFVVKDGVVTLAIPWFNPSNTQQYQQVFEALGLE
jgi:peroxiredoxin